ncbi:hypothetical protein OIX85_003897 [Vibrio parahaemolyticus]|uniref:hypothetical protein n=1 Tax=Vibrio alginolyticus TaxID=663 RepID=UPI0035C6DF9B|nr:hypothetical protein [Vibrio parahaemolyticus]
MKGSFIDNIIFSVLSSKVMSESREKNAKAFEEVKQTGDWQVALTAIKRLNTRLVHRIALETPIRRLRGAVDASDAKFKLQLADFIENHYIFESLFRSVIAKYEGNAGSADKAKECLNAFTNFLVTGEKIRFDYSKQEHTYPTLTMINHNEVVEYASAIGMLIRGNFDKYNERLSEIMQRVSARKHFNYYRV